MPVHWLSVLIKIYTMVYKRLIIYIVGFKLKDSCIYTPKKNFPKLTLPPLKLNVKLLTIKKKQYKNKRKEAWGIF